MVDGQLVLNERSGRGVNDDTTQFGNEVALVALVGL